METGQKIIQKNNNIDQNLYKLSIQVSLNGLSFCVLNLENKTIAFSKTIKFDKKLTPNETLDKLTHQFNSEDFLNNTFSQVTIVHDNELSTLVPKALFNEEYIADYLKFNSKILRTDFITFDELSINDSVNIYVPYVNINNYIYDRFGNFEYKHYSTVLIESLLNNDKYSSDDKMYVNVNNSHFEILVTQNNNLRLYNTFEFHTKEDFIYYILFTAEQLNLNPEEFKLLLLGDIKKDDDLFNIVYKYIRNISFIIARKKYAIPQNIDMNIAKDLIILNSF